MSKIPPCDKCGSQRFEVKWQGLSYACRCAQCGWGWATTRFPPIREDKGPYHIVITSLGADAARSLIALNRRFSHGIRQTREIFSSGRNTLFTGDAFAVWQEAQKLKSEGVPFSIQPDYPYDLCTYDPEHSHQHDWTSVPEGDG